jgi:hypothetical protein
MTATTSSKNWLNLPTPHRKGLQKKKRMMTDHHQKGDIAPLQQF